MTWTEWKRVPPPCGDDDEEGPDRMTTMEKFANNLTTIAIARMAMIVTPALLTFFGWLAWHVWEGMEARISAVEALAVKQASAIQDHESRLVNGKQAREQFQFDAKEQFGSINATLRQVGTEINAMNGNIIRLQATMDNRLPARTTP